MPLTLEDKRVLRAHQFWNTENMPSREEIASDLVKAKQTLKNEVKLCKEVDSLPIHKIMEGKKVKKGKKELTIQQMATLENFYANAGGIDSVSQNLLAKQLHLQKKKIQVNFFDLRFINYMICI